MTNLIIFYFEKNGEKIPPKNHKKIRVISHFLKRSHQVAKFRTQKRKKFKKKRKKKSDENQV